jgi:hypothetical protein
MTDTPPLILKRGSALRTSGRRDDDYDVLENGRRGRPHLRVAHSADAAELRERSLSAIRFR